jgi:hypothetical protein
MLAACLGMKTRPENQTWLKQARKSWMTLAQGGLWVGGILGGFVLPPPVGVTANDEKIWLRLGQFIIAILLGLVFLAGRRWSQSRHSLRWGGAALLFLTLAVAAFFRYQQLTLAWTGNYSGDRVVIGSVFTLQGLSYTAQNPRISSDDLIFDFAGQTENIWTRESINRRRLLLAATYVSCLPLFTICLIAVVQAVQCGSRMAKRNATKRASSIGHKAADGTN